MLRVDNGSRKTIYCETVMQPTVQCTASVGESYADVAAVYGFHTTSGHKLYRKDLINQVLTISPLTRLVQDRSYRNALYEKRNF